MARVMAMLTSNVAQRAKVVVFAVNAGNEVGLREDLDARVAGPSGLLRLLGLRLLLSHELLSGKSTGHLLRLRLSLNLGLFFSLGSHPLGGAIGNLAILDETLDEPMTLARAVMARGNAVLAEIVIALVANAAVEMLVGHGLVANVAVNGPGEEIGRRVLHAESELALARLVGKLGKEVYYS